MKSYFGTYNIPATGHYDSTILVFDKSLSMGYRDGNGVNQTFNWNMDDTQSEYLASLQQTRLRNPKYPGQEILIDGNDADLFIKSVQAERARPWYRRSGGKEWIRNSVLVLGLLAVLFIIYLLIVPWLSSRLASNVSIQTERGLGDAVYDAMALAEKEDSTASFLVNEFFASMEISTPYQVRITVVKDEVVNAFALPGGRIVIYDALLKQLETWPELAALLSHEFIHVNNKHATRSIFRRLGSKVFLGLLFGRFGSVTAVLVDHADNLKSLSYSRKLEKEADLEGLAILTQRKIDPKGFTDLFKRLEKTAPGDGQPEMLASHPNISRRIEYIRASSEGTAVAEDQRLKTIFDKIKTK